MCANFKLQFAYLNFEFTLKTSLAYRLISPYG